MRLFLTKTTNEHKNPFWFVKNNNRNLHSEFVNRFSKHLIQYTGTKNVGSLFWPIYILCKIELENS